MRRLLNRSKAGSVRIASTVHPIPRSQEPNLSMIAPSARVLIVDDHHAIVRGLRTLIERESGHVVVGEAMNGRDAILLARELQPQIAVVDFSLPEMNGLELSKAIKRDCPATEILMFTMHDREEIISDLLRAGVRGYVVKMDPERHILAALDSLAFGKPYFSPTVSDAVLGQFLKSDRKVEHGLLSRREREIVQLIAEGSINKQIAYRLGITVKTVETHRAAAMRKLELKTTAGLVLWAVRNNLILP